MFRSDVSATITHERIHSRGSGEDLDAYARGRGDVERVVVARRFLGCQWHVPALRAERSRHAPFAAPHEALLQRRLIPSSTIILLMETPCRWIDEAIG
jgi:hypothetical protein